MEAVAWFADEPHSAAPRCVSPVLISFGDRGNDGLPDERRQRLVPLIPRLVGTRGDGLDEQRAYMALDWLIRTYTPTWLELAGLTAHAQALRHLRRIVGLPTAQTAGPAVGAARSQAAADWVATRWDFSWDGAEVAARDAVRAATTLVAGAGAQAAAWGLTDWRGWAAAWDNAWDAAKVRRAMGRIDEVVTHHKSALALAIDVGDRYEQARALDGIAHTLHATGHPDQAREHWQASLVIYTALNVPEADALRLLLGRLDGPRETDNWGRPVEGPRRMGCGEGLEWRGGCGAGRTVA